MKHRSRAMGEPAKALCLLLLAVYFLEIGLWRSIATALVVFAFAAAVLGRRGWQFCFHAGKDLCGPGVWRPYVRQTALLIVLHAALVQAQALELLPSRGWVNLGPTLQSLEGEWHLALPHPQPIWSAWLWLSVYLFGFPALMLGTVIALHGRQRQDLLRQFLHACHLIAWVALPVFATVGVPEVWIQLPGYFPPAVTVGEQMAFYRLLNGPFNCLPSLHCTLSLLALLASWRSGLPVLRWLGPSLAVCVCLSTLISGVHWGLDVIISVPLAWLAWALACVYEPIKILDAQV